MAKCPLTEKKKHELSQELRGIADDFLKPMTREDLEEARRRIHELEFSLYDVLEGIERGGE